MKLLPMTPRQRLLNKDRDRKYCHCLKPFPRTTYKGTYCLTCQKPIRNA